MKRYVFLIPVAALGIAFFALDLHRHLSLDAFQAGADTFEGWYTQSPWLVVAGYFGLFLVVTLVLPVAALMAAVAGAVFGFWKGALVASFAAALAATLGFLLSRFLLHDAVQRYLGERLTAVNAGVARDGAFYLFSLRLVPGVPFFAVNLILGLTPMRTWTFYWVTQIGMLPGLLVYVAAGMELAEVYSMGEILSPGLIAALLLLAAFPFLARAALGMIQRRLGGD
jgi:uncharacterized membrane protein YdjX (TVP38/TMEM64 family)